jgi:SdrD B-like domain
MIRSISPRWLRGSAVTAACLASMNVFALGGTGTIGTTVWEDTNRNGVQDAGEPGVAGRALLLKTCAGVYMGTETTDAQGIYQMNYISAGSWYVEVELADGESFSPPNVGDAQNDSDIVTVNGKVGRTACFTMTDGEINTQIDIGIYKVAPATGSIGRLVWHDANRNGVQDNGETGLAGASVTLYDGNGAPIGSTGTGNDGGFLFPNLAAGCYSVAASASGYSVATTPVRVDNLCLNGTKDEVINAVFGLATPAAAPPAPHSCMTGTRLDRVTVYYPMRKSNYKYEGFYNSSFRFFDADKKPLYDLSYDDLRAHYGTGSNAWTYYNYKWQKLFSSPATTAMNDKVRYVAAVRDGVESSKASCWVNIYSPLAFDLDGDGKIGVTGSSTGRDAPRAALGKTVAFDILSNGKPVQIEWFRGDGDGILVDNRDGRAAVDMKGSRLFGDQAGLFRNGFEQLAQLDTNRDGTITGDELRGLAVWVDNGDAVVQPGEMRSLADAGIVSISTAMSMSHGLMQSSATMADGRQVLAEDVWFGLAPSVPADQPAAQMPAPLSQWAAGLGMLLAALAAGFVASRRAAKHPIA